MFILLPLSGTDGTDDSAAFFLSSVRHDRVLARRRDRINDQLADLSPTSQQAIRARQSLEEAEKYVQDRNLNWRLAHFEAADQPTTRLILAIEGVR